MRRTVPSSQASSSKGMLSWVRDGQRKMSRRSTPARQRRRMHPLPGGWWRPVVPLPFGDICIGTGRVHRTNRSRLESTGGENPPARTVEVALPPTRPVVPACGVPLCSGGQTVGEALGNIHCFRILLFPHRMHHAATAGNTEQAEFTLTRFAETPLSLLTRHARVKSAFLWTRVQETSASPAGRYTSTTPPRSSSLASPVAAITTCRSSSRATPPSSIPRPPETRSRSQLRPRQRSTAKQPRTCGPGERR